MEEAGADVETGIIMASEGISFDDPEAGLQLNVEGNVDENGLPQALPGQASSAEDGEAEGSSDDDDDIQITIGDIHTNVAFRQVGSGVAGGMGAKGGGAGKLDIDTTAEINGMPIYDLDLANMEDKPWRKPGADITDYFNYGFTEDTWNMYCERQRKLRSEYGPATANRTLFNTLSIHSSTLGMGKPGDRRDHHHQSIVNLADNKYGSGNRINTIPQQPIFRKVLTGGGGGMGNMGGPPTISSVNLANPTVSSSIPVIGGVGSQPPPEMSKPIQTMTMQTNVIVTTPAVPNPTIQPPMSIMEAPGGFDEGEGPPGDSPPQDNNDTPPPGDFPPPDQQQPPPSFGSAPPSAQPQPIQSISVVNMSVPPPGFSGDISIPPPAPRYNVPPPGFPPPRPAMPPHHMNPMQNPMHPTNVPPPGMGGPPGFNPPPPGVQFGPPGGAPRFGGPFRPMGPGPRPPPMVRPTAGPPGVGHPVGADGNRGYAGFPSAQMDGERSPASYSDQSSDIDDREYEERERRTGTSGSRSRREHGSSGSGYRGTTRRSSRSPSRDDRRRRPPSDYHRSERRHERRSPSGEERERERERERKTRRRSPDEREIKKEKEKDKKRSTSTRSDNTEDEDKEKRRKRRRKEEEVEEGKELTKRIKEEPKDEKEAPRKSKRIKDKKDS